LVDKVLYCLGVFRKALVGDPWGTIDVALFSVYMSVFSFLFFSSSPFAIFSHRVAPPRIFDVTCNPPFALCPSSSPLLPHRRVGGMSKRALPNCQVRFDAACTSCIRRMLHNRVARRPTVSRRMRMRSSSCSTCAMAYLWDLYSSRRLARLTRRRTGGSS
jgi:hypothetical protein